MHSRVQDYLHGRVVRGDGIGGGVCIASGAVAIGNTTIKDHRASTSNTDMYGIFSTSYGGGCALGRGTTIAPQRGLASPRWAVYTRSIAALSPYGPTMN